MHRRSCRTAVSSRSRTRHPSRSHLARLATTVLIAALPALAAAVPARSASAAPQVAQPMSTEPASATAEAQELIDADRPAEALTLLDRALSLEPDDAEALLLRSTARFMLGDVEAGRRDLDRALVLDPQLRQGWLNRAAVAVSEERYDDALAAFRHAEELDRRRRRTTSTSAPSCSSEGTSSRRASASRATWRAPATRRKATTWWPATMRWRATRRWRSRTCAGRSSATNAPVVAPAPMRTSRRCRPTPGSSACSTNDDYEPPPGSFHAVRTFDAAYDGGRGPLLPAVLDALQLGDRPFDPQVEVTESWALIWGDLRIKVSDTLGPRGRVQLSAPPGSFTPAGWRQASDRLLESVQHQAMMRNLSRERHQANGRDDG